MEIGIRSVDKGLAAAPISFLGSDRFAAYRGAMRQVGARFDPSIKAMVAKPDKLGAMHAALESAGFTVTVDGNVQEALAREVAKATSAVATADAAMRYVDELCDRALVELRPFQRVGIEAMIRRRIFGFGFALFDDMGMGKTLQALFSMDAMERNIVVCPASLKYNWKREGEWLRPDMTFTVISGRNNFRWPNVGEVIIINYDILPKPGILKEMRKVTIFADEAHLIKSSKAGRTKAFKDLVKRTDALVFPMTGTEMPNRPAELWNVLNAANLAKEAFGSYPGFKAIFSGQSNGYGTEWGQPDTEKVTRALRKVSLKRMKRDYLKDLPQVQFQTIPVPIDGKTKVLCDRVIAHLESKGINIEEVLDTVEITKLKGAGFAMLSKAMAALATAKTKPALELIDSYEEAGHPLVVFCKHRAPVDLIAKRPGWVSITGDTKDVDREAAVRAFQAGQYKGIVGTIGAMGVGVTLTQAANVLRIDREWTPAANSQAVDRVCRIGQKADSLLCQDMVANHRLDQRLTEILVRKADLNASTTEAAAVKPDEVDLPGAPVLDVKVKEIVSAAAKARTKVQKGMRNLERRKPGNPLETWAEGALLTLSDMDIDGARVRNSVGFNRLDTEFGNELARRMVERGGLTDKEWGVAVRMCKKYHRQVGTPPSES
jgi:SWI/SNF-related matrix-associated actin-dependent regulator 1 of chromatin subfamily A